MELLDRYLRGVRFWLPKGQQQDIIAELSSDLHSQIEDKETELGRALNDAELEAILRRCGAPIVVASRYRPQTQLIGPTLFPIYQFVLKVVLLWILVPVFLVIVGPTFLVTATNRGGAVGETLSTLWTAEFVAAGVITLIFAIIERAQAKLKLFEKWDLRSLPPAPKTKQPPTRTQSVFEMICGVLGLLYLLAIPHYPFLILGPAAAFLKPAPMWHSYFLPVVLLSATGLARQSLNLAHPDWTWFPPAARLLTTVLSLALLNFMLDAAARTPNGEWHPYVVVNSLHGSAQLGRVAAIVNLSILLTFASMWIGFGIAAIVQSWRLVRYFRKRSAGAQQPASMQAL
ncbi:MAG TPA: hypothetical protein VIW68_10995 [Candidatus Sulfotelmatobacter sp.]